MQYTSRRLSTKSPKTPKQRFSNKRRVIILASVVTFVIGLIVAYIIYSVVSWNNAEKAAISAHTDTKAVIDKRLGAVTAPTNIEVELTSITKEYKASTVGDRCDLPVMVQWQEVLWFTKDATAHCQSENKDAREVLTRLDALRIYVVQSNMIAKKLVDAAKNANDKKLKFADAKSVWQSAVTNIETQSVDTSVLGARTDAVAAAKGIITAYEGVQEAEKSQDRTKYDTAIAALGKAYDAASKVTESTKAHYSELLSQFTTAYTQL